MSKWCHPGRDLQLSPYEPKIVMYVILNLKMDYYYYYYYNQILQSYVRASNLTQVHDTYTENCCYRLDHEP